MELKTGQVVQSRQGRDVNHMYVIVSIQEERLFLADGCKRTLAKPKFKNIRHVNATGTVLADSEAATDEGVKKALAEWQTKRKPSEEGRSCLEKM